MKVGSHLTTIPQNKAPRTGGKPTTPYGGWTSAPTEWKPPTQAGWNPPIRRVPQTQQTKGPVAPAPSYGSTTDQLSAVETSTKQTAAPQIPNKSSSQIKSILGKVGRAAWFIFTLPGKFLGLLLAVYIPESMNPPSQQ